MKNDGKVRWSYLLPPAITLVIYSIILAVKGIYPFGTNTIDYYDMAQQIAAFYYHVYDSLHGTKNFFYDWYTALGVNMAMSTSGCSNISPFNLFFLFIRRSSLLKSLSVFNGIKLMCMSLTMYFYLRRTHEKTPEFIRTAVSVGYSFCGFVLVLYITNQWVDIAVMFPLVMYFYDRLMKTGKMAGYVIMLTVTVAASYYLGFMILIFIFLYTGLILTQSRLLMRHRSNKQDGSKEQDGSNERDVLSHDTLPGLHITELGTGTVLSLALSSFIVIPQLTQMFSSARFHNGNGSESTGLIGKYLEILSHVKGDYTTRWWSLLGISFMAAIIVTGLIDCIIKGLHDKRDAVSSEKAGEGLKEAENEQDAQPELKEAEELAGMTMTDILHHKPVVTTLLLILMMVLELFFESINLIWHFGSYVQYPIRNGFIIYFVFAYLSCGFAAGLYADDSAPEDDPRNDGRSALEEAVTASAYGRSYLGFIFTVIGFLVFIAFYRNHRGMPLRSVFHMTSAIMAASFVFYLILLNIGPLRKFFGSAGRKGSGKRGETSGKRNASGCKWAAGVLVFEVLCYGFLLFGKPDFITGYTEEPEQSGEYINICEQLREGFSLKSEFLARIKNPDESLNANYGLVLMQPALSNWTHMIAPGEQEGAASWGYSIQFTRLLDSGGTVFSDALLGVKRIISCVPMDEHLYEPVPGTDKVTVKLLSGETVQYSMYRPKYTLPFGILLDMDADTERETQRALLEKDTVGLHNAISSAMKGSSEAPLARWLIRDGEVTDDETVVEESLTNSLVTVTMETKAGDETALYLLGSGGDREYANCTVEVLSGKDDESDGGTYVKVPTIGDPENIYYPAHFNNNALYLGCYKDETVRIRVSMDTEKGEAFGVGLMGISMKVMKELCSQYPADEDNDISADGRELGFKADIGTTEGKDNMMLLPVTYDKGWKVMRNGHRVRASSMAGLFTAIPLVTGENYVTMKFTPPGMRAGTVISLSALLLTAAYMIILKVKHGTLGQSVERIYKKVSGVITPVYIGAFAAVILLMYIVPVIWGIISLLK